MTKDKQPDYLGAAKANLEAPNGITLEQFASRAAAAQAQATIALAEQQAEANRHAETANLIAYLNTAGLNRLAYSPSEAVLKAIQSGVEVRLGLA